MSFAASTGADSAAQAALPKPAAYQRSAWIPGLSLTEGARAYITGHRKDALNKAIAEIGEAAVGVQADSSSHEDLDRLFA